MDTPEGKLPIGAVPSFGVTSQFGGFSSVSWSGGAPSGNPTYGGYLTTSSGDPAPATQGPPSVQNNTNQGGYSFIVQPEFAGTGGTTYDVSVTVTYSNDPTGTKYTSHMKFQSDPPSVASLSVDHLSATIQRFVDPDPAKGTTLQLAVNPIPFNTLGKPEDTGIRIKSQTATHDFSGQFMFLQTLASPNATYYRTRGTPTGAAGPVTIYLPNGPNGGPADVNHDGAALGYETENGTSFWGIATPQTAAPDYFMNDSPSVSGSAANWDRLAAGYPGGGTPKSYTTILMFRPDQGASVWEALYEVTWSWGMSVIVNPNGTTQVLSTDIPQAVPSAILGYWPTWSPPATNPNDQLVYNGNNPWPQ